MKEWDAVFNKAAPQEFLQQNKADNEIRWDGNKIGINQAIKSKVTLIDIKQINNKIAEINNQINQKYQEEGINEERKHAKNIKTYPKAFYKCANKSQKLNPKLDHSNLSLMVS